MKQLESDNLELLKALKKTTENLKIAMLANEAMLAELRKSKTDEEIDAIFTKHVRASQGVNQVN